jgi:uncharacterized protein HemY
MTYFLISDNTLILLMLLFVGMVVGIYLSIFQGYKLVKLIKKLFKGKK